MQRKEQIIRQFREEGKRVTSQRNILLDVILEGGWSCSKEIYYRASKRDPSIGLATVYRMLNTMEELGVMNRNSQYSL